MASVSFLYALIAPKRKRFNESPDKNNNSYSYYSAEENEGEDNVDGQFADDPVDDSPESKKSQQTQVLVSPDSKKNLFSSQQSQPLSELGSQQGSQQNFDEDLLNFLDMEFSNALDEEAIQDGEAEAEPEAEDEAEADDEAEVESEAESEAEQDVQYAPDKFINTWNYIYLLMKKDEKDENSFWKFLNSNMKAYRKKWYTFKRYSNINLRPFSNKWKFKMQYKNDDKKVRQQEMSYVEVVFATLLSVLFKEPGELQTKIRIYKDIDLKKNKLPKQKEDIFDIQLGENYVDWKLTFYRDLGMYLLDPTEAEITILKNFFFGPGPQWAWRHDIFKIKINQVNIEARDRSPAYESESMDTDTLTLEYNPNNSEEAMHHIGQYINDGLKEAVDKFCAAYSITNGLTNAGNTIYELASTVYNL